MLLLLLFPNLSPLLLVWARCHALRGVNVPYEDIKKHPSHWWQKSALIWTWDCTNNWRCNTLRTWHHDCNFPFVSVHLGIFHSLSTMFMQHISFFHWIVLHHLQVTILLLRYLPTHTQLSSHMQSTISRNRNDERWEATKVFPTTIARNHVIVFFVDPLFGCVTINSAAS